MAKYAHDDLMDAYLDALAAADRLVVCSALPTTYEEANVTYKLAIVTLTAGDGNGDFTVGNGDASGRKVAVAEQANMSVTADGTATHIALLDSGNSKLLFVTTCNSQALTNGNTVTAPTWDIEVADPV